MIKSKKKFLWKVRKTRGTHTPTHFIVFFFFTTAYRTSIVYTPKIYVHSKNNHTQLDVCALFRPSSQLLYDSIRTFHKIIGTKTLQKTLTQTQTVYVQLLLCVEEI